MRVSISFMKHSNAYGVGAQAIVSRNTGSYAGRLYIQLLLVTVILSLVFKRKIKRNV